MAVGKFLSQWLDRNILAMLPILVISLSFPDILFFFSMNLIGGLVIRISYQTCKNLVFFSVSWAFFGLFVDLQLLLNNLNFLDGLNDLIKCVVFGLFNFKQPNYSNIIFQNKLFCVLCMFFSFPREVWTKVKSKHNIVFWICNLFVMVCV